MYDMGHMLRYLRFEIQIIVSDVSCEVGYSAQQHPVRPSPPKTGLDVEIVMETGIVAIISRSNVLRSSTYAAQNYLHPPHESQ